MTQICVLGPNERQLQYGIAGICVRAYGTVIYNILAFNAHNFFIKNLHNTSAGVKYYKNTNSQRNSQSYIATQRGLVPQK